VGDLIAGVKRERRCLFLRTVAGDNRLQIVVGGFNSRFRGCAEEGRKGGKPVYLFIDHSMLISWRISQNFCADRVEH
jgi:hypothetical protein